MSNSEYPWPKQRRSVHSPKRSYKENDRSSQSDSDDDFDVDDDYLDHSRKNVSLNSTRSANLSDESIDKYTVYKKLYPRLPEDGKYYSDNRAPHKYRSDDLGSNYTATKTDNNSNPTMIYIAVVIIAIFIGALTFYVLPLKSNKRIECSEFKELTKHFNNQDLKLWKSLKAGIENVVNQTPAEPSVFLLAYHDMKTSKNIMAKILNATANCMKSRDPIQLDGSTFATDEMLKDYGEIIAAYRQKLENEGIMYVSNLHKLPAAAAQAFHTICDTVTPFVERSVIFFTMYVDQYDGNMSPTEIHRLVETQLEKNWIDINIDTLRALIGRVTDQVFLLHSENDML